MIFRYFLYLTDATLALKYDVKKALLSIGGNARFSVQIKAVAEDYFHFRILNRHINMPQVNKMRIDLPISEKAFLLGKQKLTDEGFVCQQTKTLERIMR